MWFSSAGRAWTVWRRGAGRPVLEKLERERGILISIREFVRISG
jgi:hypothetical protein